MSAPILGETPTMAELAALKAVAVQGLNVSGQNVVLSVVGGSVFVTVDGYNVFKASGTREVQISAYIMPPT